MIRSSPMETECIMIVVDNSEFVPKDSDIFKIQFEAIRIYCRAKFKSNPETRVGVATIGSGSNRWPSAPNSNIQHFLAHTLKHLPWGGEYSILRGLQSAMLGFPLVRPGEEHLKFRMLVFVAGPCHGYLAESIPEVGKRLKTNNVALDVVGFPYEEEEYEAAKTTTLRSFVAAANNNNNSHFARLLTHSPILPTLQSSKILSFSQAEGVPFMEEETKKKKKKLKRNRRKNKHHSQEDPVEEPHVSSSPPPVILPAHCQVPQKYKNQSQLLFGSWQMHQLVDVLSPSP